MLVVAALALANNGRHVKIDELTGKLRQSFWSALRPPGLNRNFIGGIARLTQALPNSRN
jgi:hypothetical protein